MSATILLPQSSAVRTILVSQLMHAMVSLPIGGQDDQHKAHCHCQYRHSPDGVAHHIPNLLSALCCHALRQGCAEQCRAGGGPGSYHRCRKCKISEQEAAGVDWHKAAAGCCCHTAMPSG